MNLTKNIFSRPANVALACACLPALTGCVESQSDTRPNGSNSTLVEPIQLDPRPKLEDYCELGISKIRSVNGNTNLLLFPAKGYPATLEEQIRLRPAQRFVNAHTVATGGHGKPETYLVVFEPREVKSSNGEGTQSAGK